MDIDTFPVPVYACQELGCTSHYNVIHGYFDASEGESIQRDMTAWLRCQNDGLPMYLAQFEPLKSRRTWQCSQFGCNGSRITEGPLQAGATAS
jgi:hypothetical protein